MLPTSLRLKSVTLSRPQSVTPAPLRVSEAEYWEKYYEDSDHHYEWNNGYLEEKGVSDYATILMYDWFVKLLDQYLIAQPIAQKTILEMGFRLILPNQNKVTIRKPDLGVVRYDNPVSIGQFDNSYHGICDLCVEALSHSTTAEIRRDTQTKKQEYATAGVKEYYILYAKGEPMAFYRLNARGLYVPIKPVAGDLIKSKVLPGFQFRRADLSRQPSLEEMSDGPLYQSLIRRDLRGARMPATGAKQKVIV